ncbi:MAG: molybdopterin converting factor subunit 1 [Anaerolineae bacterium]|nr:molybdopterin converting factor subunit 1 [Anaerolineae bacterium]
MIRVHVRLFAILKDQVGQPALDLSLPLDSATIKDVRQALASRYPAAAAHLDAAIAARNKEYAFAADPVQDGDEVAFFPPVSGGEGWPLIARLAAEPIDLDEVIRAITVPATGAVCLFSGMVRGETSDGASVQHTQHLEYEAYESMAVAKMQQVADEIRVRWPLVQGIAIIQRVGKLEVGENTIVIACASGHRDQGCFEAARYGIDRLKEIVPVWKKEVRPEGDGWVVGKYMPTPEDRSGSSGSSV